MSEGQPGKERRKAGCDHRRSGQLTFSSCLQEALKRAPGRSMPANRTQQNGRYLAISDILYCWQLLGTPHDLCSWNRPFKHKKASRVVQYRLLVQIPCAYD